MYEIFEKLMKEKGVSAYKVGKDTGINPSTFTHWKNRVYEPKMDKMQKLADYFGVSLEYLMTGEDLLDGVEDELEYKLGQITLGNDTKKRDFLEVVLQLDDEDMEEIKKIALRYIEAKKKG